LIVGYAAMAILIAAVSVLAFHAGRGEHAQPAVAGAYRVVPPPCGAESIRVQQSGRYLSVDAPGADVQSAKLIDGTAQIRLRCTDGSLVTVLLAHAGSGARASVQGTPAQATRAAESTIVAAAAPKKKRSGEETFGRLMAAIALVILAARLTGAAVARIGQPQVMGEVLAGIALGPTILGALAPEVQHAIFPADIVPLLSAGADIGLAYYMFLVGLELEPRVLRGRAGVAAVVSNASVVVPMALGLLVAVPLFSEVGPPGQFAPFALFMGVAMSVTAFPVLARILVERRMLSSPTGAIAIAAAAVDDVTAWGLLALASAIAGGGAAGHVAQVLGLTVLFVLAMVFLARPLLARLARAYDEAGRIPTVWLTIIFVGVLATAWASQGIGIAAIFGPFVMGLVMPRRAELTADVTRRLEDFVVIVLLPLFFVTTGLKTQVGLLDRPVLWAIAGLLLAVAVVGKWTGAVAGARWCGLPWRESAALGALMNTRGMTELIVLGIGLELGVITPALFAMLVLMAIITTLMTGPTLKLIDRPGALRQEPVSDVLVPSAAGLHTIVVAVHDPRHLELMTTLAARLAASEPRRSLVIAQLLPPARLAPGTSLEDRAVEQATAELARRRTRLAEDGIDCHVAAFTSPTPGADVLRLAAEAQTDLVLLDGRRPLIGGEVPRGDVGQVLSEAPCDVAVLVSRSSELELGPDRPVAVPFGGGDHDWAALEMASWIAARSGAGLRLIGVRSGGERDASRALATASLMVQRMTGVLAEPVLVEPGAGAVLAGAGDAALLVVGLADDWRSAGLGEVRAHFARHAEVPLLFVRRGQRPGALASRSDQTRFRWSMTGTTRLG
jgi:Kef-type K+ transport system membrane component KefB